MPNSILEEKWTRWYPEKISLKDVKKNKKILCYLDKFRKEDFLTDVSNQKNYSSDGKELEIDFTKTKSYKIGFQKGLLQGKEENILLKNKLNALFLDFENSLSIFENNLCNQLIKTILKISSYVIGKKINIDKKILVDDIKKIIRKDGIFLKKPQIIVHSQNKILIEDIFKDLFNVHEWTLVCDDSIDVNGCKIKSESVNIDTTVDARWQQVCHLIDSEEF